MRSREEYNCRSYMMPEENPEDPVHEDRPVESGTSGQKSFLDELKAFLEFTATLWGVLAGITVFFPLSNDFFGVIPLEINDPSENKRGAFEHLTTQQVTVITTLSLIIVIYVVFGRRRQLTTKKAFQRIRRHAIISFLIAAVVFVCYMSLYLGIADFGLFYELERRYGNFFDFYSEELLLITDFILLILYASLFAFITRGFLLLAMADYFEDRRRR
jgi:hypothetical protein